MRRKHPKFADPVTSTAARDPNPGRCAWFVRVVRLRRGKHHSETCYQLTDRKGKFWETCPEYVVAGHIPDDEAKRIFLEIQAEKERAKTERYRELGWVA